MGRGPARWVVGVAGLSLVASSLAWSSGSSSVDAQSVPDSASCDGDIATTLGSLSVLTERDLSLTSGSIGSQVVVGGEATLQGWSIGGDLVADSTRVDLMVAGDIVANNGRTLSGAITYGGTASSTLWALDDQVSQALPVVDASAVADAFRGSSAAWADLDATGSVTDVNPWWTTLRLEGDDPDVNVFRISADELQTARGLELRVPLESTALVVVDGAGYATSGLSSVRLWNGSDYADINNSPLAERLVWAFPDAATVDIGPNLGWAGTVIAPDADVTFTGGSLRGGVLAGSLTATNANLARTLAGDVCLPPAEVTDAIGRVITQPHPDVNVTFGAGSNAVPADVSLGQDRSVSLTGASQFQVSPSWDFNIPDGKSFTTADITIRYEAEAAPAGSDESNMQILFFDEGTGFWIPVDGPQTVDTEANTVTATVTHFSIYAVFVIDNAFFEAFGANEVAATCLPSDSATGFDIVFAIDTSGSMRSTDPARLRVSAAKEFVDTMRPQDRAAVVTFNSTAVTRLGFTSVDSDANQTAIDSALNSGLAASGGTSIGAAVDRSVGLFTSSSDSGQARVVILLTDGGSPYNPQSTVNAANESVTIYTVGLGTGASSALLEDIAAGTGGRFRQLTSASQLGDLYAQLSADLFDDGTDTDSDGLTDCQETNGVITPATFFGGEPVRTKPDAASSDDDDLLDGEELVPLDLPDPEDFLGFLFEPLREIEPYLYVKKSDPNEEDTDGDGLDDDDEVNVHGTKPLKWDSDNDNISDKRELDLGSDPNDVFSPRNIDPTIVNLETPITFVPTNLPDLDVRGTFATFAVPIAEFIDDESAPFGFDFQSVGYRIDGLIGLFDPDTGSCDRTAECPEFWSEAENQTSSWEATCRVAGGGTGIFNTFFPGGDCNNVNERVQYLLKDYLRFQDLFLPDGRITPSATETLVDQGCIQLAESTSECFDNAVRSLQDASTIDQLTTLIDSVLSVIPGGRRSIGDDGGFEEQQRRCNGSGPEGPIRRPSAADVESPRFKDIFGDRVPKKTPRGENVGTKLDGETGAFWEFKGGSTVVWASYQIRLQIFFAAQEGVPYKLVTDRTPTSNLRVLLDRYGGQIVRPC